MLLDLTGKLLVLDDKLGVLIVEETTIYGFSIYDELNFLTVELSFGFICYFLIAKVVD